MNDLVIKTIANCAWDVPHFFVFSSNVFDPLIYYSHLVPLIISLILVIFIFKSSYKLLASKILFITILLLCFWIFADLIIWATNNPKVTMFLWSLVNMIEPIIYAGILYFLYVFVSQKDMNFYKKLLLILLLIPTILLTSTHFSLLGYDLTNCDRDAIEGPLVYYNYLVEIFLIFWILFFATKRFFSAKDQESKQKILYVTLGALGFLIAFAFGNIIGSLFDAYSIGGDNSWAIGQYGLFGVPIFLGYLTYMIVRFRIFNIKLIATQALVWATGLLVGAQFLFIETALSRILNGATLVFVVIFGYLLIKTVKKEVMQREQLQILSEQLFDANEKLKGLDKLKTEFLSLASHQLRSPLTAMKGYSSMLIEGDFGEINPKAKDAVERIFQSTMNLTKIVEDFLNVSKIEGGGMKYEMAPFSLAEIARDMSKDLSITAGQKGLKLNFESDSDTDCTVNGDKEKIRQVVLNFIDNSIKYTKEGTVNVSVKKAGNKVVFSVKDTGMGMTPEIKATLFQKFARGDGARMNTGGSGLGLYLAKEIIEAHKGIVDVTSEGPSKGSTFSFTLDAIKS